jgi:hypothetical protein
MSKCNIPAHARTSKLECAVCKTVGLADVLWNVTLPAPASPAYPARAAALLARW